jgi:ammonia channel protein AmtB
MKNEVNILMTNVIDVGLGGFTFWCLGYGLAFGDNPM